MTRTGGTGRTASSHDQRAHFPVPSHDNGVPAQCPVPLAIEVSKAVVRAADREARWPLWDGEFTLMLKAC